MCSYNEIIDMEKTSFHDFFSLSKIAATIFFALTCLLIILWIIFPIISIAYLVRIIFVLALVLSVILILVILFGIIKNGMQVVSNQMIPWMINTSV
jgi:hypothetical protein